MKIAHGGHKYTIIKNGKRNNKQNYAIRNTNNKYIKQSNNLDKLKIFLFNKVKEKEIDLDDLDTLLQREYILFKKK